MFEEQELSVVAADGHVLVGTLYRPAYAQAAVLLAPATGIRRRFYRRFASALASQGFAVLTFDNRGIGDSLHGRLKDLDATLVDWGRLDMPAMLDALERELPNLPLHLIGHSAGGQLVGLMPNAGKLQSFIGVAASSGYIANMAPLYRTKAVFFLRVLLPATSLFWGAGRSDWVGMGEPLPRGVARQWGEWCAGGGYVEVELKKSPSLADHLYDSLSIPSLWIHASDDDIANRANVEDMLRVFSGLDAEVVTLDPVALGKSAIGHMGFFREPELWPLALDWLESSAAR